MFLICCFYALFSLVDFSTKFSFRIFGVFLFKFFQPHRILWLCFIYTFNLLHNGKVWVSRLYYEVFIELITFFFSCSPSGFFFFFCKFSLFSSIRHDDMIINWRNNKFLLCAGVCYVIYYGWDLYIKHLHNLLLISAIKKPDRNGNIVIDSWMEIMQSLSFQRGVFFGNR